MHNAIFKQALGACLLGWSLAAAGAGPGCEEARFAAPLTAGQHWPAGRVDLHTAQGRLWIDVSTDNDWCLQESHLHVATDPLLIPQTRQGNPRPGRFAHGDGALACSAVQRHGLGLDELDAPPGTWLAIAYHAVVDNDGRETAWAGEQAFPGASWARYIAYQVIAAEILSPQDGATVSGRVSLRVQVDGAAADDVCEVRVTPSGSDTVILLQAAGLSEQGLPLFEGELDTTAMENGLYLLGAEVRAKHGTALDATMIEVLHPAFELQVETAAGGFRICPTDSGDQIWQSNLLTIHGADEAHGVRARASGASGQPGDWSSFTSQTQVDGKVVWTGRVSLPAGSAGPSVPLKIQILDAAGVSLFEHDSTLSNGVCGDGAQSSGDPPGGPGPAPAPGPGPSGL